MQKRTYILLVVAVILAIGLGVATWYGIDAIITLKNGEDAARGEFQSWMRKSKQVYSLRKTLERATAVDASLQQFSFVVTDENQIQLLSDFERIGKMTGVKIDVKDLQVAPDSSSLSGSMSIVGDWKSVYHALQSVEAYPIKISVSDINISAEGLPSATTPPAKVQYRANVRFAILHTRKP